MQLVAERLHLIRCKLHAATLHARAGNKPFATSARTKLLLVSEAGRIPQSQIFPFHYFARDLQRKYQASVREVALEQLLSTKKIAAKGATTVAFQTHYDISDSDLDKVIKRLQTLQPDAKIVYLDWSAPTDLRNAERMSDRIDLYVKKHVLRDREAYGRPTQGDTNLADHYSRRLGLNEPEYCFSIPEGFMEKLLVGPSFVTAPGLLHRFNQPYRPEKNKTIDLHARFATEGTPWYQAMRSECDTALNQLGNLNVARGASVPLYRFTAELKHSKICFSPFGYGEVCWRDFEAIMTGSVLLKPDMSHIETYPDIFRPMETYIPVRWDMEDFEPTVRRVLEDEDLCNSIAKRAFEVLSDYASSDQFADQMAPLFGEERSTPPGSNS